MSKPIHSEIATASAICLANHPPARGEHCYRLGATAPLITLKKVLTSIESPFAARNRSECDSRNNKRVPVQNSKTLTLSVLATNQSVLEKKLNMTNEYLRVSAVTDVTGQTADS